MEKASEYVKGGWKAEGDMIPSIQGMACYLDVSERVIYDWGNKNEEFLHILNICKTKQHNTLTNGGLSGDLNAAITKLVLGKHGYHDNVNQQITGKDGGPVKTQSTLIGAEMSAEQASQLYRDMLGED